MKKFFVVALAAIAMVACTNDEVISIKGGDAIAFADAFVDNATRAAVDPSTTTASIENFDVWGFMDNTTAPVFEGEDVTKVNGAWTYANTQYWFPNHTYYFAALSPMNSNNCKVALADATNAVAGLGEVEFTNINGTEDLLYAATKVTTAADINKQPEAVKFEFNHLLSKVKFTFKNGFGTDAGTMVVKDIEMTAPAKATIDLAGDNKWVLGAETLDLEFGDVVALAMGEKAECENERLTIPADANQVYKVTFTVEIYVGAELAQTFTEETEITNVALEQGKAYNFVAELNSSNLGLFPITFDVVVNEWAPETEVSVDPRTKYVKNAAELQAALDAATSQKGYNIVITDDIEGVVTVTQKTGVNIVIDGADHTYTGTIEVDGKSNANEKTLTVKNLNFKALATTVNFINCSDDVVAVRDAKRYARVIVDDCTFEGPGATSEVVAVRLYQPFGVTIKNSTATGLHSLAQITSATNEVVIEKVTVTDCAKGINISNSGDEVVISECLIEGVEDGEYGVRIDNTDNALIEKSTIKADQPIVLRKYKAGNTKIVNINNTTLDGEGDAIIVEGEAAPAIYIDGVPYGYTVVTTDAELAAALTDNAKIALNGTFGHIVAKNGITLWGINNAEVGTIDLNGADNVTLKGITFDAAKAKTAVDGKGNAKQYASVYSAGSKVGKGSNNVVIDGCTFDGTFTNGGVAIAFVDQNRTSGQSGNITVKNCVFEQAGAYYTIYTHYSGKGYMIIENNTFASNLLGLPIYLGRYQSSTAVVVKGNTFNTADLAASAYIQAHSGSYTVSFDAADNTFGK